MKAAAEKLDVNKLLSFPSGFNNLKAKVDGLDVDKLKTVPVNLKVVKNTKFSKLNTKVNGLENKILDLLLQFIQTYTMQIPKIRRKNLKMFIKIYLTLVV